MSDQLMCLNLLSFIVKLQLSFPLNLEEYLTRFLHIEEGRKGAKLCDKIDGFKS